MEIIKSLDASGIIRKYTIQDFRIFKTGFFIKIEAELSDDTRLFIKEYSDEFDRKYSFHWQKANGDFIIRWDNSPHHKEIITYPHHKHERDKILPNYDITIDDVLKYISRLPI